MVSMTIKRSAHLLRTIVEGISSYSAYRGSKLTYVREFDSSPTINVDVDSKIDIEVAINRLFKRNEISLQEIQMIRYVILDGRLSRRDISAMIKEQEGYWVDQRTISRRLESAYWKIAKEAGWEYGDARLWKMIAKKKGYPPPYILSDDEIDKYQQLLERI